MISTTLPFGEDKTMDMVEKKKHKKEQKNPKTKPQQWWPRVKGRGRDE